MSGALADFPGELAIVAHRGGWKLLIHGPYLAGEVTSPKREKLERLADAYGQIRDHLGPRLPAAEADRVYFPGTAEAHLVDLASAVPAIYCDPDVIAAELMGTGTQEEREYAASLPLCRECGLRATGLRAVR